MWLATYLYTQLLMCQKYKAGEEGFFTAHFKELLENKNNLMFNAESGTQEILGFLIGRLMPAPEVYNPGVLILMIDDFCVKSENLW